jgi:hypothetical protein
MVDIQIQQFNAGLRGNALLATLESVAQVHARPIALRLRHGKTLDQLFPGVAMNGAMHKHYMDYGYSPNGKMI